MRSFAVSWDYRCPFARNAHEHVLAGLAAGAPWEVTFLPFSLDQVHVEEGQPDVWDDPGKASALLALQVGVAVRDSFPGAFPAVHLALFSARHDEGRDLRQEAVLRDVLRAQGVDADDVFSVMSGGGAFDTLRKEHERAVVEHHAFGVPTFVTDHGAAFVRLMSRPHGDAGLAVRTVERVLDLVEGWPELNELKHTTIPR